MMSSKENPSQKVGQNFPPRRRPKGQKKTSFPTWKYADGLSAVNAAMIRAKM